MGRGCLGRRVWAAGKEPVEGRRQRRAPGKGAPAVLTRSVEVLTAWVQGEGPVRVKDSPCRQHRLGLDPCRRGRGEHVDAQSLYWLSYGALDVCATQSGPSGLPNGVRGKWGALVA